MIWSYKSSNPITGRVKLRISYYFFYTIIIKVTDIHSDTQSLNFIHIHTQTGKKKTTTTLLTGLIAKKIQHEMYNIRDK